MSRKVFVLKDEKYARTASADTTNAANNNPFNLAEGSLGVYGVDPVSANNAHKLALITDGGSDAAGLVPAASFAGKQIQFAVGLGGSLGADMSPVLDIAGITVQSLAYTAPVKKVIAVGYHPSYTSNSLNLPGTILRGDAVGLVINDTADPDYATSLGKAYSGAAPTLSATGYAILKDLFDRVDADPNAKVDMEIFSNGTGTAFVASTHFTGSGTAQIAATNGSKVITVSAATSLTAWSASYGAGTLIKVGTATYTIVSVGTPASNAVEITLDREYQGATFAATNVSTTNGASLASVTEYGFTVTDKENFQNVEVSVSGLIEDADKVTATALVWGTGTAVQVGAEEDYTKGQAFGVSDFIDRRVPQRSNLVDSTLTYDIYRVSCANSRYTSDPHAGRNSSVDVEMLLAFPSTVADTAGENQSNFEDIMAALGVTIKSLW